ncbi:MAG: glycerol-3-phosphate 1-O-acyltransferase PlsB [Gammaproteobacteria bacterium]|nr:glycerol-3-phosphate 1-O-acyltransferase PlsB [Gammaproteobacteria bacterium]
MSLTTLFNYITHKLLYLWIKVDVIHAPDTHDNNSRNITIYVFQSRALSDLLVVEHECKSRQLARPLSRIKHNTLKRWHHAYTVAHSQPLKAWLKHKNKHSVMLTDIYQTLLDNPLLDVSFIPVVVFWGRPVLKQRHWLRVLFADTWGFAGRTRRFFTILFNGKNTLLQFSPAISFRQLIAESTDQNSAVDMLQAALSRRLVEIKTATLGPDISHRRTLVKALLENPDILTAINNCSQRDNITVLRATKIAQKYLNEIVADRNYITIQLLQRILASFWNKFYSGIEVNFTAPLNQLALSHELIYVPCHRSHIDYLLLSYVIHNEGFAIPYIAAGKNLNLPVIGPILRKGGAFFIRRSFNNNELYSTIMFEYLASQISSNMPIEYFIEGGRSRTGRLLQPKPGMLAMTIRAFLKYQKRPIAFIPVYIGYEKMIEGKAYLAELKGDDKKSETLMGSIRSILNIRGFYGQVTTNFGEPVLLTTILDEQDPNWKAMPYDDKHRADWLRPAVAQTSNLIMQHINACCAVNAVNLIATALLAAPNQTMDEGELARTLTFYAELIDHHQYSTSVTITSYDAHQQIHHAEALHLVHRRKHEMGDFIYLDKAHAVLLTYYRNNILHLLVMPSLISCCFNNATGIESETIKRYIKIAYPFLKAEFFLPWSYSESEHVIDRLLVYLTETGLLTYNKDTRHYSRPGISTHHHAQLTTLAQVISPILELYYMIFALLAEHESDTLSRARLEELCYLMAQRLSLMYEINSPDFFDKKLIANFINSLISLGYVSVNAANNLELCEYALNEGRRARRLLDKSMQYNILQMLRTTSEQHKLK